MVLRLIDDLNKALDAGAYMAALALALMLPDICAKAEFPRLSNKKRYTMWYDSFIGNTDHPTWEGEQSQTDHLPYLSGEVVYNLRCNFLHQGTLDVDKDGIKDESNQIDKFTLLIEEKKPFDIYADISMSSIWDKKEYYVNVRRLCLIITLTCKKYYEENKDKFSFVSFKVIDWDLLNENM